ncbi:MAG: mandelate racemase/muconate lactonizing enzyme family protein [Thermomicrobiales bacterium]
MKITSIECHVLLDPDYDPAATSSAQDDLVVEVHTDEGIVGIGESDINPWIGRECIEAPGTHTMDQGLGRTLIGLDPLDHQATWRTLYENTAMTGRRGALVNALGAIDMALWDIKGKAAGVPAWQLMGERSRDYIGAYASLQPEVDDFDTYLSSIRDWARRAKDMGFSAAKLETTFSGPYANMGLREDDEKMTEVIRAARAEVGDDFVLMVDVQYAFDSVERATRVLTEWEQYGLFFVEAPLWVDDVEEHARLAANVSTPLASGEWLSTHYEFKDLVRRGNIAVLQPDIGRVGGLTEALKVTRLAAENGRTVVPHLWKTGISVAAAAHLATVTPHMPFFEFLPPALCESRLRKELVVDEVALIGDGRVSIPERPGLGVELNRDALEMFKEAARKVRP